MPHRVSPTDRVRGHIDELFASGKPLPEILEDVDPPRQLRPRTAAAGQDGDTPQNASAIA